MKKSVCLALALLMLLTSCGSGGGSSTETTAEKNGDTTTASAEKTRLDELGDKDFTGKTLTILNANSTPDIHQNMHVGEENGDVINDAIYRRDAFIEGKYGAKIEYVLETAGGSTLLANSVLAGDRDYDLIISVINNSVGTIAKQGILANLCDMDYLTLDAEWWSPLVYESCRVDDIMYYTTGDFAPSIYCAPACMFLNKKVAEDYKVSVDDLYTSVTDGKWTYDMLYEITKDMDKDLNGDDVLKSEDDFFGMSNESGSLAAVVFTVGAGGELCKSGGSSDLYLDLDTEKMANIIEKVARTVRYIPASDNNSRHEAFKSDRALFYAHYVSSAYTRYRDMESDFAILPIPKYDEAQSTYRSLVNSWCNSFIGVATNATDEYIPFLMEAMAYYSHENVRPASYENAFLNKGARDERDAEMLNIIFDTLCLDLNFIENFGKSLDALNRAIFEGASFSTEWASVKTSVRESIDKFVGEWTNK